MNSPVEEAIQHETYAALARILGQIAMLAVAGGMSIAQIESLLRVSAVRSISSSPQLCTGRVTISRLSALTGLSRPAISNILKTESRHSPIRESKEQYTNRVLGAWYSNPQFLDPDGVPKILPIFGKGVTLESLVRKYSSGIPIRALLDELIRVSAVEIVKNQRVRAKSLVGVSRGINRNSIKALGVTVEDYFQSLLHNLRDCSPPRFIASAEAYRIPESRLPYVRNEIAKRGSVLVSELQESILNTSVLPRARSRLAKDDWTRVGVTVFYYESPNKTGRSPGNRRPRKNYRRR